MLYSLLCLITFFITFSASIDVYTHTDDAVIYSDLFVSTVQYAVPFDSKFKLNAKSSDSYRITIGELYECFPNGTGWRSDELTNVLLNKMGWTTDPPVQNMETEAVTITSIGQSTSSKTFTLDSLSLGLTVNGVTPFGNYFDQEHDRSILVLNLTISLTDFQWWNTNSSLAIVFHMYLNDVEYIAPPILNGTLQFGNMFLTPNPKFYLPTQNSWYPLTLFTIPLEQKAQRTGTWFIYPHFENSFVHSNILIGFVNVPHSVNKGYIGFVAITAIAIAVLAALIARCLYKHAKKRKGTFYRLMSSVTLGSFSKGGPQVGVIRETDLNNEDLFEVPPMVELPTITPRKVHVGKHKEEDTE